MMVKISATVVLEIDVLSRKIHLGSLANCIQIFLLVVIFKEMILFRLCVFLLYSLVTKSPP